MRNQRLKGVPSKLVLSNAEGVEGKPKYIRKSTENRVQRTEGKKIFLATRYLLALRSFSAVGLLVTLILPKTICYAATYYVDANAINASDNNPGTSNLPWKTWSKTQLSVTAGDTIYLTGDFGSIAFNSSSPAGTADNWITYKAWPGKTQPTFSYISLRGTGKDIYVKFDGLKVDPGYVTTPNGYGGYGGVVNLRDTNYVDFENCDFEGEKIAGLSGDFVPYAFPVSPIITAGESPPMSSHITINNCTFKYGWRQIYIFQHPNNPERPVQYWTITNNDFSEWSEDAIMTSVNGYITISNNYLHNGNTRRGYYNWPGTANGDWSDKFGQTVTQDTTQASGVFYQIGRDERFYIYSDDLNHLPSRTTSNIWRLDSDPFNTYFTPSGSGDSCHTDGFAVQSTSHDITIKNNIFRGNGEYCVGNKIEPAASNITLTNNLFFTDTYGSAFMLLLAGIDNTLNNNTFIYENTHLVSAIRFIDTTAGPVVPEGQNLYLYNNIISGAFWSSGGTVHSDNNIWGSQPPAQLSEGTNSQVIANLTGIFVNRAADDFRLAQGSVAIDFGDPAYAPATDIEGNPRDAQPDAGCYEYGALPLRGDLNKDGKVNIQDVQCCVNHISGKQDWESAADVNGDGTVDKADVQEIIKIILKK